jgi:aspartate/methionine/tyrosine aminotransferase
LAFSDDVIVINSFSKYHCMTGWRIGWMVVPAEISRAVECLYVHSDPFLHLGLNGIKKSLGR